MYEDVMFDGIRKTLTKNEIRCLAGEKRLVMTRALSDAGQTSISRTINYLQSKQW